MAEIVENPPSKRRRLFLGLIVVVSIVALIYSLWWWLVGSRYVTTDNAYVAAEVAQVTAATSGIVQEVAVVDTEAVRKGDRLVVLDNRDARLALQQAEAELDKAGRRVQGYFATDKGLSAQVAARNAEQARAAAQVISAKADRERAQVDLKRREALAASGSVSAEEITTARNALATAEANLSAALAAKEAAASSKQAAVGSLNASTVMTDNTTVQNNPEVALAKARRDQAAIDLERTVIRAPVDGVVVQRKVQIGQHVMVGAPLMAIVPLAEVHVDANFKEVQLRRVHPGQKVELKSDLYGSAVKYHGKVMGLSGGTGAAFALIPAQNATGNWIKVVQRLPVRISLDSAEIKAHPLQVGLSMTATVALGK